MDGLLPQFCSFLAQRRLNRRSLCHKDTAASVLPMEDRKCPKLRTCRFGTAESAPMRKSGRGRRCSSLTVAVVKLSFQSAFDCLEYEALRVGAPERLNDECHSHLPAASSTSVSETKSASRTSLVERAVEDCGMEQNTSSRWRHRSLYLLDILECLSSACLEKDLHAKGTSAQHMHCSSAHRRQ